MPAMQTFFANRSTERPTSELRGRASLSTAGVTRAVNILDGARERADHHRKRGFLMAGAAGVAGGSQETSGEAAR
jgi:hypothetical protein